MKKIVLTLVIIALAPILAFTQPFTTEAQWETYFKSKIQDLDPIEGIWSVNDIAKIYEDNELVQTINKPQYFTCAVYKADNKLNTYIIGKNYTFAYKITLMNTASNGVYLGQLYYRKTSSIAKTTAILSEVGLELSWEAPSNEIPQSPPAEVKVINVQHWIKIFPKEIDFNNSHPTSGSGTGFGISSNGIIVTNNHVIDNAKSIKIRGINSDFNKTYMAKVLISDKNNDLALIQIDEIGFNSLGSVPYSVKMGLAGVGENIFVLGYPLRATMGDEIKLTNGIISSKTGFQGDISSYQISAPVQPGNSGGPLFDSKGNIIGIINAKHSEAENASYAVKSSYLTNLIELLPNPPKLQTVNSLTGKNLTQQVEIAKKFVYIIETE